MDEQSLGLTGVGNARELGGYMAQDGRRVKRGVLLRSAAPAGADDRDIQRLTQDYHLSVLVDFRMGSEAEAHPDPVLPGVKNVYLPIIDEAAMAAKRSKLRPEDPEGLDMTNKLDQLKMAVKVGILNDQMYVEFLSGDQGKEGYRKLFEELLALPQGEALLFHCTQGKDRTGCAAMLILSALGVDEKTILDDFLLTNAFNAQLIQGERQELVRQGYEGEELDTMMNAMDQVDPRYMTNALDWMRESYGSAMGYLTQALGLTQEQIETLRSLYLEEAPQL